MKRILLSLLLIGLAWSPARAETCLSQSSPPSFPNAQPVPTVCDSHGTQKVMTVDEDGNYVAGGGGGTATLTEQETQTTHLSAIETAVEALDASIPAAAALADATSNPTTTGVAAYNMCFNGTTWDRCVKASAGAGNSDSTTTRVVIAKDSAVCNAKDTAQAVISTATSGNVELVALTSGQTIYVCDFTLVSTGTVAVQLVYGTGTACGTGETNMTGAMPFVANGGWTHNYDGRLKTAEANALCIELSAATQIDGVVTYRKAATF